MKILNRQTRSITKFRNWKNLKNKIKTPRPKTELTINIIGQVNSGKSSLSMLLQKFFYQHDIEYLLDGDSDDIGYWNKNALEIIKNCKITIKEIQVNRSNF